MWYVEEKEKGEEEAGRGAGVGFGKALKSFNQPLNLHCFTVFISKMLQLLCHRVMVF